MKLKKDTEAKYTSSSVATEKFGIEFRSKLEAQWAYFFDKRLMDWTYVDKEDHDFVVNGVEVEVKPISIHLIVSAIKRARLDSDLLILAGEPNNHLRVWCENTSENTLLDMQSKQGKNLRVVRCSFQFPDSRYPQYASNAGCTNFTNKILNEVFFTKPNLDVWFAMCRYDFYSGSLGAKFEYHTKHAVNSVEWGFVFSGSQKDRNGELAALVFSAEFSDEDSYGMQCSKSFIDEFQHNSLRVFKHVCNKHFGLMHELKTTAWYRSKGGVPAQ